MSCIYPDFWTVLTYIQTVTELTHSAKAFAGVEHPYTAEINIKLSEGLSKSFKLHVQLDSDDQFAEIAKVLKSVTFPNA